AMVSIPAPPYSSGTSMPMKPSCPISRMVCNGKSPDSSNSAAMGAIELRAKSRAACWIILCSSVMKSNMGNLLRPGASAMSGKVFGLRGGGAGHQDGEIVGGEFNAVFPASALGQPVAAIFRLEQPVGQVRERRVDVTGMVVYDIGIV